MSDKNAKHTPGPWRAEAEGCLTSHSLPVIVKSNGHLVAQLCDRNVANARLIAAAPELLEALQLCKRALYSGYMSETSENRSGIYSNAYEVADATIRKAKGDL
jgi:hypothetical protein